MKYLKRKIAVLSFLIITSVTGLMAQNPSQIELPKIDEATAIGVGYNRQGQGKISAANSEGKVRQVFEIWEDKNKAPNVITYMLYGEDRQAISIIWGKGPVNPLPFNCSISAAPEFGPKTYWVAISKNAAFEFTEITEKSVKDLFDNLIRARQDWDREANASNQRRSANTTEQNVLGFVTAKNRKKWVEFGWLQPASTCIKHF